MASFDTSGSDDVSNLSDVTFAVPIEAGLAVAVPCGKFWAEASGARNSTGDARTIARQINRADERIVVVLYEGVHSWWPSGYVQASAMACASTRAPTAVIATMSDQTKEKVPAS